MPVTGKDGDLTLFDLIGKDYNDEMWNELLDMLTPEEMLELVNTGAFSTAQSSASRKTLPTTATAP